VPQLRIHPHAIRDANAYYDPVRTAVLFGYFNAADQLVGANHPGGLVCTCLSPDIVAHEVTHALLDSVHHRYMEDTNPDVGAFHEGFADIVALLQRFTFTELVEHQLFQSGGRLDRYTVLGELATQFGEALEGSRGALRSAIGEWTKKGWMPQKPNPRDYANVTEAHDRGALLVATIFDAFQRVYTYRTRDLLRIATSGTGVLPEGSISRDLVHRLALEASSIAEQLLHICIRALDYCPPTDITFGNYLRALITADMDIAPEDDLGYRIALIEAFRARGIFPDRVNTFSAESLRWSPPDLTPDEKRFFAHSLKDIASEIRDLVGEKDRERIYERSRDVQRKWRAALMQEVDEQHGAARESFLNKMGLTAKPVEELFDEAKGNAHNWTFEDRFGERLKGAPPPIEVYSIRPVFRAGREGKQIQQVLIMVTQTVRVVVGKGEAAEVMFFRGGSTLVLPLDEMDRIEYAIAKNIGSWNRFKRQLAYMTASGERGLAPVTNTYASGPRSRQINLKHLHNH
jgi:hypothetical protein